MPLIMASGSLFRRLCSTWIILQLTSVCRNVSAQNPTENDPIQIAGIMNTDDLEWTSEVWEFTMQSLQNKEPWFLDLYPPLRDILSMRPSINITHTLRSSKCDPTTAVRAYWDIRSNNPDNMPPHALIGAYCSGASISLARIAGLEGVLQVSPFSTSSQLSDTEEFPYFARMLAPDDDRGEVGALVSALRMFGWSRISIIATDRQYAKDWETEFRNLWAQPEIGGVVEYSTTVRTNIDGTINEDSVRQAIQEIPTEFPEKNSRIILLAAHSEHAFPILEMAESMRKQPDTIWVGPSSWIGKDLETLEGGYPSWLPSNPGFLGAVPSQNANGSKYQAFLSKLQESQQIRNQDVWQALPSFAPQLVDAIVAMAMTLLVTPSSELRDGSALWNKFRGLSFTGIGGPVQFSTTGDLANPSYTIEQLQGTKGGSFAWENIGFTGNEVGSSSALGSELCFPEQGCSTNLADAPSDSYPVPRDKVPTAAIVAIVAILVLLIGVALKYWRSRKSKSSLKEELDAFRDSVVGMRTAQTHYLPNMDTNDSKAKFSRGDVEQALIPDGGTLTVQPKSKIVWCWQETASFMDRHDSETIEGDPADCWIKYKDDSNVLLESSYQNGDRECYPIQGYVVNFKSMTQAKLQTGFSRQIKRVVVDPPKSMAPPKTIDLQDATIGEPLPSDLMGEPQMVLVKGDIVQISKQRKDGWAFGTKLHHKDEAVARELVAYTSSHASETDQGEDANVFSDTGWFPLDVTDVPSGDELLALQQSVGDTGALEAPSNWDPVNDPTIVQYHKLPKEHSEYQAVAQAFKSTLNNRKITSLKIERIQNLAMWQSYVVKRQTICYRESQNQANNQKGNGQKTADQLRNAMERFERCWLWHGTNVEIKDKIVQQGFNRSFCGKNATMYGKGVYFARDASYSSYKTYAVPDSNGMQYILACRVVVGEYCTGKKDALTPDVRDTKSQSLYDSTVGLLSNDSMANPSIYVTYHDAQAYPEYLISFKQKS